MVFTELQVETSNPKDFLKGLKAQNITNYNQYLLFNLNEQETIFYQNLEFLKGKMIWTKEELSDYTLIAQTIDNDYLLASSSSVLVIPSSLNKKDSEIYNNSIKEFLIQFEDKTLVSNIISVN